MGNKAKDYYYTFNEQNVSFYDWVMRAGPNVPAGNCIIAWRACEDPEEYRRNFEEKGDEDD